jgi:hypothetical protein
MYNHVRAQEGRVKRSCSTLFYLCGFFCSCNRKQGNRWMTNLFPYQNRSSGTFCWYHKLLRTSHVSMRSQPPDNYNTDTTPSKFRSLGETFFQITYVAFFEIEMYLHLRLLINYCKNRRKGINEYNIIEEITRLLYVRSLVWGSVTYNNECWVEWLDLRLFIFGPSHYHQVYKG